MRDLDILRAGWDHAAVTDAMFNIVTHQGRENGGWTPDEFFEHGQKEVRAVLTHLDGLQLRSDKRTAALDFGCGVGRLTQALADEYDQVYGADISGEMIARARELNRHDGRCLYLQTGERLLDTFEEESFDLIYSRITLQHMPQRLQEQYIGEFVKLLVPDGLAVFQIPDGPEYRHSDSWLSMYGVPRGTVEDWIFDAGGNLLDVELLEDSNPMWLAYRYTVTT